MQKHNDAMKMSGHSSLEKYTSHFIERVVCERELETEQNCNILTPNSYGHNSISFPFSCAAQPGAWGPSHSGTWSSFQHLLSNCNCSIRGTEGPLCWVLVLSTASPLQLTRTSCRQGYIIIWRPLFFPRASQFHTQFNPSTVKVIFWYSSTRCTCYLHRCISYFDSLAGSEVNIQHYYHTTQLSVAYIRLAIIRHYVVAFFCLHFALQDTRVPNSNRINIHK